MRERVVSSSVLYQIPYATWPIRAIMIAVSVFFVLAIFGWWLPRAIRLLRRLPGLSAGQAVGGFAIAVIPLLIGFGPLAVLVALIRNPVAYVTAAGVTKESVFQRSPVSFSWGEIKHVYCQLGTDGSVIQIALVATDGRRIELGNTGGVDFASMHELFHNQLGPMVVDRCERRTSLRP
jgi:hypothetical protein